MVEAESKERLLSYWRFVLIGSVIAVLDLVTKLWVLNSIEVGTYIDPAPVPVIPGFLYWVHIYNTGAAWGILAGQGKYLALLAVVVLIGIVYFRKALELERPWVQCAIGLIAGGTVGNLVDRLNYGYVIDFIDVHLPGYRYPAFNVADMGISVGAILYFLIILVDIFKKPEG